MQNSAGAVETRITLDAATSVLLADAMEVAAAPILMVVHDVPAVTDIAMPVYI
jgi:hypothetical protein